MIELNENVIAPQSRKELMIEIITKAFPYPKQITKWNITVEANAIRFTWRESRFRVDINSLMVEAVDDGFLRHDNIAILAESLIKSEARF